MAHLHNLNERERGIAIDSMSVILHLALDAIGHHSYCPSEQTASAMVHELPQAVYQILNGDLPAINEILDTVGKSLGIDLGRARVEC